MLRYMATPPALWLDDDNTATDDVAEICLRLVVLQYIRSKPGSFTGMESSIRLADCQTPAHFCHTVDARLDHQPHNWLLC
ncbi:hypothetical protein TNCV_4965291 [Trichonephila clavipes]|nr:hypothetical protein TNCV_4965291 [Trichonephila clavipes]